MFCPVCGLGAYVNSTELGYLCVWCLHHWPYSDPCCNGDYDYEKGHVVHENGCHGSVLANEEAKELTNEGEGNAEGM